MCESFENLISHKNRITNSIKYSLKNRKNNINKYY